MLPNSFHPARTAFSTLLGVKTARTPTPIPSPLTFTCPLSKPVGILRRSICEPRNQVKRIVYQHSYWRDGDRRRPLISSLSDTPETCRVIQDEVIQTHSNLPQDGRNGKSRMVQIQLKTEDLGGRRRRISGGINIPASRARVWSVLTAYEKMEDFMPNILVSAVQRSNESILVDQIGLISRKLRIKSRMLMRVHEDPEHFCVKFERIEGRDFQNFNATYSIEEVHDQSETDEVLARLNYNVIVVPFPLYPMALVENKSAREVPKMLAAIRDEAVLGKHVSF